MFKIVATPELIELSPFRYTRSWLKEGYWLCVDPLKKQWGYVENWSINSDEFIELKELNQGVLNQLVLLHSLGFSPKEIAEIING